MTIYPRGTSSVWVKTPQAVATLAKKLPWRSITGTSAQIPARTRGITNSETLNAIVGALSKR